MDRWIHGRTCVVCRKKKEKNELLRIVYGNGQIQADLLQKAEGRGVYVCKDKECILRIGKKHAFDRFFKKKFSDKSYEACMEELGTLL